MGKNQGHKAAQQARYFASAEGAAPIEPPADGLKDASFHTAAWHEARIKNLMVERPSWEEYKDRIRAQEEKEAEMERLNEEKMREYRAQLDADRAARLAKGTNHLDLADKLKHSKKRKRKDKHGEKDKSKKRKRESKDKDSKKKKKHKKSHKKKRRHSSSGSSGSSSSSSDRSSSSSDTDSEDAGGPVRLSDFFKH